MATTLETIARATHVSPKTVSNVLNGRYQATRRDAVARAERIRRVAEQMGYRPNAAARAMSSGRFHAIGLLHPAMGMKSHFPAPLRNGVYAALEERDLHLVAGRLPESKMKSAETMPRVLRDLSVDGLLMDFIADVPPVIQNILDSNRIPSIWMNVKLDHDCVRPDDLNAGRDITRHLIESGCKRIAWVSMMRNKYMQHYSSFDRITLETHEVFPQWVASSRRRDWADTFVAQCKFDAVVCAGEYDAMPLYVAAARLGLEVPGDLSIATFGESPLDVLGERLTTWWVPFYEVGLKSVELLTQKIEDPSKQFDPLVIPFKPKIGSTTWSSDSQAYFTSGASKT